MLRVLPLFAAAAAAGGTSRQASAKDAVMYRKWPIRLYQVQNPKSLPSLYIPSHIFFAGSIYLTFISSLHEQAKCLYAHHGSRLQCTFPHLQLHIRCWVELILRGNDAAEHSRAREDYDGIQSGSRCSPDIAYYYSHLHSLHPLVQIQIQIRLRRLNSPPELQLELHLDSWMWIADLMTCTH